MKKSLEIITAIMIAIFLLCVVSFNKWGAYWFGINIFVWAIILGIILYLVLGKFSFFSCPYNSVKQWLILVLAIAFILSIFLGIYFTEPIQPENSSINKNYNTNSGYDYHQSRSGIWWYSFYSGGNIDGFNLSTENNSDDGEAILYLFIIILVIILVIGSAFIPHFWILSLILIITVMIRLTVREHNVYN